MKSDIEILKAHLNLDHVTAYIPEKWMLSPEFYTRIARILEQVEAYEGALKHIVSGDPTKHATTEWYSTATNVLAKYAKEGTE